MNFIERFADHFTDAKGRGELKIYLGLAFIGIAIARLFMDKGVAEFSVIAGMGFGLIGITALADHKIDNTAAQLEALKIQAESGMLAEAPEEEPQEKPMGFSTGLPPETIVVENEAGQE
jgi:hypothetical protein